MNIVDQILALRPRSLDKEHDVTFADIASAIRHLLAEIVLKDDAECEKLDEWEDQIAELRCKISGNHEWEFDQCGYWGHQYCLHCDAAKHPELASLSCRDAVDKVGKITEEEYIQSQKVL